VKGAGSHPGYWASNERNAADWQHLWVPAGTVKKQVRTCRGGYKFGAFFRISLERFFVWGLAPSPQGVTGLAVGAAAAAFVLAGEIQLGEERGGVGRSPSPFSGTE